MNKKLKVALITLVALVVPCGATALFLLKKDDIKALTEKTKKETESV